MMRLRDHFRPPLENTHSWDELHGMWPAVIVQQLFPLGQPLPVLPIWLDVDLGVSLDLEASYEEICRVLRIV
jgi:hypothetical protein